jgi:hypothetical protein
VYSTFVKLTLSTVVECPSHIALKWDAVDAIFKKQKSAFDEVSDQLETLSLHDNNVQSETSSPPGGPFIHGPTWLWSYFGVVGNSQERTTNVPCQVVRHYMHPSVRLRHLTTSVVSLLLPPRKGKVGWVRPAH